MKPLQPAISRQPSQIGRLRHVPPVATPVRAGDLWRGALALFHPERALADLRAAVRRTTGSAECYLVSSGRAALTAILLALKETSDRSQVVVPAYTCPTVVQAVLAAGLEPTFCDSAPGTLDLDRTALGNLPVRDVLAVVPTHLYGLAQDVSDLIEEGQLHGFHVVEDAAQAFGARFQGQMVGTRGAAGFYSLGRGKCLPAGQGGIVVAQQPLAGSGGLPHAPAGRPAGAGLRSLVRFAGYALATHPRLWWFVARTSLNPAAEGMNVTALPPVTLGGLRPIEAALGLSLLSRLDQVQEVARSNARRLMGIVSRYAFVAPPEILPGAVPVYLRLPLLVNSPERTDRLFQHLGREGIGVSRSYFRTLPELYAGRVKAKAAGYPGAARLAACLLTLPTHPFLRDRDFEGVARALDRAGSP